MSGSGTGVGVSGSGTDGSTALPAETAPAVTVLVADDDEVTRSGLSMLLAAQPGISVLGEASDGVEAVDRALSLRPDVVLMDVRMPRRNGIEATRRLLAETADPPKVVVITTFENDGYVTGALSAGASGFVLKRLPVRRIAEAVRVVAAGEAVLFPAALGRMVAARPLDSAQALPRAALTVREEEVLRLMATGLSNPEIAEALTVSMGARPQRHRVRRTVAQRRNEKIPPARHEPRGLITHCHRVGGTAAQQPRRPPQAQRSG
ncbi:Protein-glutamate methylesterase/protein-glutamine glutaminase [Streptomyces microflavus]